ncbi:hypothetical protein ACJIZ3_012703 [Penstemon smallii]|uniref:Uncharacterized protein n=1 Tax=Penstemon smallii TaxID=265156 RepID=A0ABD3UMT1_9LAMI
MIISCKYHASNKNLRANEKVQELCHRCEFSVKRSILYRLKFIILVDAGKDEKHGRERLVKNDILQGCDVYKSFDLERWHYLLITRQELIK